MKEVTYEEWQKNPTPRMMWCWNWDEEAKIKQKVVYMIKDRYSVIAVRDDESDYGLFMHCAEIEKMRRMTRKELSRWLREKPTRECKLGTSVFCSYNYSEAGAYDEVFDGALIREDDGEWREPLVEE